MSAPKYKWWDGPAVEQRKAVVAMVKMFGDIDRDGATDYLMEITKEYFGEARLGRDSSLRQAIDKHCSSKVFEARKPHAKAMKRNYIGLGPSYSEMEAFVRDWEEAGCPGVAEYVPPLFPAVMTAEGASAGPVVVATATPPDRQELEHLRAENFKLRELLNDLKPFVQEYNVFEFLAKKHLV